MRQEAPSANPTDLGFSSTQAKCILKLEPLCCVLRCSRSASRLEVFLSSSCQQPGSPSSAASPKGQSWLERGESLRPTDRIYFRTYELLSSERFKCNI